MTDSFDIFIQKSPAMASLVDSARLLAALDVPVFITGETGVGKSLLANTLVSASARAAQPYITVNCAALDGATALEQLFGDEGYALAANGGTLLLDEVSELPLSIQAALLRFVEQGEVQTPGSAKLQKLDVRILAATNADMLELIRLGRFRQDLYQRLNVVPVHVPSLRERDDDLSELLRVMSAQTAQTMNMEKAISFSASALSILRRYSWPGNVRELNNLCTRLSALLPAQLIEATNLPQELLQSAKRGRFGAMDLVSKEVALIRDALEEASGNKSRAARLLGISRDTLNYRLKKYDLS